MGKINLRGDWLFFLLVFLYLLLGIVLIPFYSYHINPDGISYISIALKYSKGDFVNAINGYWGPLMSWFLVPFLWAGAAPVHAARLLLVLLGAACLFPLKSLFWKLRTGNGLSLIVLLIVAVLLFSFSLAEITPDLLLTFLLLVYFNVVFDEKYISNISYGLLCGFLGALAYLSKEYGFYFFIFHFTLFSTSQYFKENKRGLGRQVLVNFAIGLFIFSVVAGTWSLILTKKYGRFIVGNSGSYNLTVSDNNGNHPVLTEGFFVPQNNSAVSAWEDPSGHFQSKNAIPAHSVPLSRFQRFLNNCGNLVGYYLTYVPFSVALILFFVFSILLGRSKVLSKTEAWLYFIVLLYPLGYLWMHLEARYLLVVFLLLILLSGQALNRLRPSYFRVWLLAFIFVTFLITPVANLVGNFEFNKETSILANNIKNKYSLTGVKLASNSQYNNSLEIAYLLNSQYYGMAKSGWAPFSLKEELYKYRINYFLDWCFNNCREEPIFEGLTEVTHGEVPGLLIYKIP